MAAYAILGINVNMLADKKENAVDVDAPKQVKTDENKQRFVPRTSRGFTNSWR